MRYYFPFYAKRTNDTKLILNASKLPPIDAHSSKGHYKDIALRLPLSGQEKSKVNPDDERDYKQETTTYAKASCTHNTPSRR